MALFDGIETQVKACTDAEDAAILLLNDLSAKVAATSGDPVKASALAAQLKQNADKLGAAIVANTPQAPPAP